MSRPRGSLASIREIRVIRGQLLQTAEVLRFVKFCGLREVLEGAATILGGPSAVSCRDSGEARF